MNSQQRIFFDFLQFCIGSVAEIPASVKDANWKVMYTIAKKQALIGVLFHGIKQLPKELAPDTDLLFKWMGIAQKIRQQNIRLFIDSAKVSNNFKQLGFRNCILKGQGNALLYPDPYMRTPGDIDIWVEGGDKRVISFVRSISPHEKVCYHHIEFPSYKGVEIEVHYRPSFLQCFWHNRRLQKYYGMVKEEQFSHRVMLGEQGEIAIPTVEFNLIFQLTHIYAHLMNEGIGLRQLLDYYFVLLHADMKDVAELQRNLRHIGIWKFAGAVMYVLHEVLGLSEEKMIVPMDKKRGKLLLAEILSGGNFGQYDERHGFGHNSFGHNMQRLCRDLRLMRYYPAEALSEPIFRTWHFFWRIKNRK